MKKQSLLLHFVISLFIQELRKIMRYHHFYRHPIVLTGLAFGLFSSLITPAWAGKITRVSAINAFTVQNDRVDVKGIFEFTAHPGDKETINNVLQLVGKKSLLRIPSRNFVDGHKTTARGDAIFTLSRQRINRKIRYTLTEQARATITPRCPKNAADCGPVSMTTTTERKVTITASGNENTLNKFSNFDNNSQLPVLSDISLDVFLSKGTKLGLGGTDLNEESVVVGGANNLIYSLDLGLSTQEQLVANFSKGLDNSYFSYLFDGDTQIIENRAIDAFTYNSEKGIWSVNQDTYLFSVTLSANTQNLQSIDLFGVTSLNDPDIEVPGIKAVPEPSSTLSFLALGTLGVGTILQRSKKQKFAEK